MGLGAGGLLGAALFASLGGGAVADDQHAVKEASVDGPGVLRLTVKMQGPYDAEVPLQVVCYFKHKATGDTTTGAPVELDRRLGGVIAGDELETILLTPPEGAIKSRSLLLIGLGDEETLSLERMERVGL